MKIIRKVTFLGLLGFVLVSCNQMENLSSLDPNSIFYQGNNAGNEYLGPSNNLESITLKAFDANGMCTDIIIHKGREISRFDCNESFIGNISSSSVVYLPGSYSIIHDNKLYILEDNYLQFQGVDMICKDFDFVVSNLETFEINYNGSDRKIELYFKSSVMEFFGKILKQSQEDVVINTMSYLVQNNNNYINSGYLDLQLDFSNLSQAQNPLEMQMYNINTSASCYLITNL